MAGSVTADVFECQALTLLRRLMASGFEIQVAEPDILRVRPVERVTPELRAELQRYKPGLLILIRISDTGVQDRREAFVRQLETAPSGVLVPRLVFRKAPYVTGRCHTCGEALERARWGSCWRCSLARRLACHAPVAADLFTAYDEARISASSTSALATPRDVSLRPDWPALLQRAAAIVKSYETQVTLRQLFYRLVAAELLPNTTNAYKSLSRYTAEARRAGKFPPLMDRGRTIHRDTSFANPAEARRWLLQIYRRDRTEGQPYSLYLAVEKAGIVEQLREWFGDLGVPVLALGGYGSQTYVDDVVADVEATARPAVLLYAGDHDPSGEDIDRDFTARTDCWSTVRRVALTAEQVERHALPPQPGKETDSRARRFMERHGRLVQVELDALAPDILRDLYANAIAEFWNSDAHEQALAREATDRCEMRR